MALTGKGGWDETIVPALRKRLETESRILAKRISIASVSSLDDSQPSHSPRSSRDLPQSTLHLPDPTKSSAIPRPSLQYARTTTEPPRINGASPVPARTPKRARTYSQPPSPNAFAHNPLPTPDSSRPTSPRTSDVKPTRIPVAARTRTTSTSSHAHPHRANSRNGSTNRPYQLPTPDTSQEHRPADPLHPSTPPMASIRHQASSILNEPAPFTTPSLASSTRSRMKEPVHPGPRPSNDSEERPFEHWYRGDVYRNGGVGELRVAKHVEMLQIANYGHNLRNTLRGQAHDLSGHMDSVRSRKRADSVGVATHESLYFDEPATDVNMVLDETPLTDIEADPDDPETFYDAYTGFDAEPAADDTIRSGLPASSSSHPLAQFSSSRSQTPTNAVLDDIAMPRYPQATADPLRSGTPSAPLRTSAESAVPASATESLPRPGSRTTSPISQSSDHSHTKRRAKSPVASSPASTPKKARTKPRTPPTAARKDDPRSSVATYPTPEGDIVNAIPTWTQPVLKSGNWDEVVLPVVARKRGLNGQYEQADGSPKPRPRGSPLVKPAPGTFGYDYAKYRPPRIEEIQMHQFDRFPEPPPVLPEEEPAPPPGPQSPPRAEAPQQSISPPSSPRPEEPIRPDPRHTVSKPPDSPAPFSHYHVDPVPMINITRASLETVERRQVPDDEVGGGCCRCVIM